MGPWPGPRASGRPHAARRSLAGPQPGVLGAGAGTGEHHIIYEDNKACISISEGDTDTKRTKHIAKHFHFVKEKRAAGLVALKYLATALQVADMFTKQIFPKHFERLRRVMMGHENFDDMCERYQDAKAAGDDVDDPKIYTVKPERNSNG